MSDVQGQEMRKESMEFQNSRKENSKSFQGWAKREGWKEEKREKINETKTHLSKKINKIGKLTRLAMKKN